MPISLEFAWVLDDEVSLIICIYMTHLVCMVTSSLSLGMAKGHRMRQLALVKGFSKCFERYMCIF